jgi:hypothetical protein
MLPAHRQYYVTARDGPRTYFLAGPYDTHAGYGRAWFMAYGTSRGPAGLRTALGVWL